MEGAESKSGSLKSWGTIIVGIGGLLVGISPFVYQNFIQPERAPRTLAITTTLNKVAETNSLTVFKGTLKMKNITNTRVELLAGFFNVYGFPVQEVRDNAKDHRKAFHDLVQNFINDPEYLRQFHYHIQFPERQILLTEILYDDKLGKAWWDPDLEYSREFHVFVPRGRYQLVQLWADFYYAKSRQYVSSNVSVDPDGSIRAEPCKKLPGFEKDPSDSTKCASIIFRPIRKEPWLVPDDLWRECTLWLSLFDRPCGVGENDAMSELYPVPTGTLGGAGH